MRLALLVATVLLSVSQIAPAQDAKQQRINHAIDAAERICLVGDRYKFEASASGGLTISKLLPGGKAQVVVDHANAKGAQFFDNEVIRREVDSDIRECMKSQWPSVLTVIDAQTYKKIACTGEFEGNCPGRHDAFYTCGYIPSDEQIATQICKDAPSKATRINTSSGNHCGYALIEVTCN